MVPVLTMALACIAEEDPTNCGLAFPDLPDGYVNGDLNFAWQIPDAVYPTIYLDVASFTRNHDMDEAETKEAAELAVAYWNAAGANFTLSLDTDTVVCGDANYDGTPVAESNKEDCVDTTNGDSTAVLYHGWPGDNAAVTREETDTKTTKDGEHTCRVAADIYFSDVGEWCEATSSEYDVRWEVRQTESSQFDCSLGYINVPFYNTFLHELGHVLGFRHNSVEDSVMREPSCEACDYESIGSSDSAALSAMYPT